jgi:hypothetical protein
VRLFRAFEERVVEQQSDNDGDQNAQQVHGEDGEAGKLGEKDRRKQDIDREAGAATHKRHQQPGEDAVALVLQCARCVDRRNGAAKADDHRQEALALQADFAHQPIHHHGRTRHVAAIFQQGKHQVERQHNRYEDQDAAHAGDDTVDRQALDPGSAQPNGAQQRDDPVGDRAGHDQLDPVQVRRRQVDRHLEDHPHQREEDGDAPNGVGDDAVELVRLADAASIRLHHCILHDLMHERVAPVDQHHIHVFPIALLQANLADGERRKERLRVGRAADPGVQRFIAFQELDRQPAWGVRCGQLCVAANHIAQARDLGFDRGVVCKIDPLRVPVRCLDVHGAQRCASLTTVEKMSSRSASIPCPRRATRETTGVLPNRLESRSASTLTPRASA